eukprot:1143628-Pelagomonas_calceolata.AAC.7
MHLDLSQHVVRNVNRFRLRAHTLKVETAAWDTRNALLCDRCSCDDMQDEAHAPLVCRAADVCALRRKHAYLFNSTSFFPFASERMDIMLTGEDQSQADQPNSLAEVPPFKPFPTLVNSRSCLVYASSELHLSISVVNLMRQLQSPNLMSTSLMKEVHHF